jgi:L-asparaginase II
VRRGAVIEARHRIHAVAVKDGRVIDRAGDPDLVALLRSSAKPFQAVPLVRELPDLPYDEIAIACASHAARDEQLEAVRSLLARSNATEDDLECGEQDGSRLRHNCSGKHAGMLLLAHLHGWPRAGYRLPDHPVQREIAKVVAEAAEVSEDLETATDGCGVPTHALPLERMARMFGRLARGALAGCEPVVEAIRTHPDLLGDVGGVDVSVMKAVDGAIAKGGAEALLCIGLPDGTGIALKVEDGSWRALGPATGAFLGVNDLRSSPLFNSRGEEVGSIAAA